ncbi:MAG: hypothetical protein ACLRKR_04245 [Lachnospiraceae bacterium]
MNRYYSFLDNILDKKEERLVIPFYFANITSGKNMLEEVLI